jgi:hypothetical protein
VIDPEISALLRGLVGRSIARVRRIQYVKPDGQFAQAGPLELTFSDGQVVLMEVGPGGEVLRVSTARWLDPFAEPLSPENRTYVNQVGKWTAFDVTDASPYVALRDQPVVSVVTEETGSGELHAVQLRVPTGTLHIRAESDELVVDVLPRGNFNMDTGHAL